MNQYYISVFESWHYFSITSSINSTKRQLIWLTLLSFNFVAFIEFLAINEAKLTAVWVKGRNASGVKSIELRKVRFT